MTLYDHDYIKYPELTNTQLEVLGFTSPHVQITRDFQAKVVKVHDGDTITLETDFRDFQFPLRLLGINSPELNENRGKESQQWLSSLILDQEVMILIDRFQRVGKYGRLLGVVFHNGMDINRMSIVHGLATSFETKDEGQIPNMHKIFAKVAF